MPELPEVERVRLSLVPHLVGRSIRAVRLLRRDICESFLTTANGLRPGRTTSEDLLVGAAVKSLLRHGKQIAVIADDGRVVCVHLGMSGQLRWKPAASTAKAAKHTHAVWGVTDPATGAAAGSLVFRDPRRFGGLWTFPTIADLKESRWAGLGPDALAITTEQLGAGIKGSRRSIKAALLDQTVLAGVGNIYADEALFLAKLRPTRLASGLKLAHFEALAAAIRGVLARSIGTGGSTLRDYVDADGNTGNTQRTFAVYGRGGQPCVTCGGTLKTALVAQRTTVWCPRCQR